LYSQPRKSNSFARVLPNDIGTITRRFIGEATEYQDKPPSITSKAFQMFKENKSRIDIAIALNLETDHVVTLLEDYLKLMNLDKVMAICKDLGGGGSIH